MLRNILSEDEYRSIPETVVSKVQKIMGEHYEQYLTYKALLETYERDQEKELAVIRESLKQEKEKNESTTLDYDRKCSEIEQLSEKLNVLDKQNLHLKNDIIKYENEARTYRLQRDDAVDERTTLQAMLNRRSNELEHLKLDYDSLNEKFKSAVQAKIEALASLDEIQFKKVELDFKEKRLDQEKELLTERVNLLTNDVTTQTKELMVIKKEHSSQVIGLQTTIQARDEEIRVLLENEENYKKQMKTLNEKVEELNLRLTGQSEVEIQLQNKYAQEIDSRTKLANLYKEMSDESNCKVEELAKTAKELQKLLSEASSQYGELEKKYAINEATYEEHLHNKNETIAALKTELVDANTLIETLKREHLTETLETLSPHAAAAYNMMKKGLTLTQIYTEYASVSEQLMIKTHDNEQLQNTFKSFIEELEGKAHIIKKRNEDYAEAMETIERISRECDQLEMEHNVSKEKCMEAERNVARLSRDKEKLQKTISDLSRQVCFLLKEVEEARGGEIITGNLPGNASGDSSSCVNSSEIISKELITFRDVEELQQMNQKLLNVIRDLSEEYEKAEKRLNECDSEEIKDKISRLENALAERVEAANRQEKIIQMLKNQIKLFQMMSPSKSIINSNRMVTDEIDVVFDAIDRKQIAIQTDNDEIESMVCLDLRKELEFLRKQLAELKSEFETSTKEHVTNERMMLESIEKSEKNYQKLSQDYKKLISRAEMSEEKCQSMALNVESLRTEIKALENRCRMYTQTIGKHEQTIYSLREEAMNSMSALSRCEVMLENSKRECTVLRESETRLATERNVLKQDKQIHSYLLSNLESIKTSIERSDSEWKLKMDDKFDSAMRECSALRRRLQDEQDKYAQNIGFLEKTIEILKNRLEDENKSRSELTNVANSLKLDIEEKNRVIEELQEKMKSVSSKSVAELELSIKNIQNKYENALKDIEHQRELLNVAKKDGEDFRKLSENMEKKLVSEHEIHSKYEQETESKISEMSGELVGLRARNEYLQKRVDELAGLNETSMVNLSDELQQERHKYSLIAEEFANTKLLLVNLQKELKTAIEAKLIAEKKYTTEMMQHTNDIEALQSKVDTIFDLEFKLSTLAAEKDEAIRKAETVNTNWLDEEARIRQEIDLQNEKMKTIVQQNELLLNQIQELSLKMAVTQRQDNICVEQSTSFETGEGNTDNLLQLINYLRREKNLANSQLAVLSSENRRLKSEVDLIKCQLDEANLLLKAERDKSDISSTTAAKHAELINKVQTLNALTDSNRVLREERDRYSLELAELKERISQIENNTIQPLRNENKRFQVQVETLQTEVTGLSRECVMWRNRVTEMTERMNKTNSEELKDLKKTLNKEREEYNKTLESLRSLKQEKSKLEDQVKKLTITVSKLTQLEKERADIQKELLAEKVKLDKVGQDFKEYQVAQESELNKHKASNGQLKSIARKYKNQCAELTGQIKKLTEQVEQLQAQTTQTPTPVVEPVLVALSEVPVEEQNRLRQEGRQQLESEINEQIKLLNDEVTANQTKIGTLEAENKSLIKTVAEKDVRNTDILHQARGRIQILTKRSKKLEEENQSITRQLDEHVARENVVKSRIAMLEKEKMEAQAERDRLSREVDVLMQRLNTLQRQLNTQQGVKTSVNSSQEKGTIEPPTANIKPMAGPSSSVTKSQQNQQSIAVTPWRSANETPLASIRPMSMQTRTAAVLPTSQTTCSASQSTIMVPPQQQLVDTSSNAPSIVEAFSSSPSSSSHSDYNMPSTSSSIHPSLRQVVVTPTQQTPHSAESTQDEAECVTQELSSQTLHSNQQSAQLSQNQSAPLCTLSQIMTTPAVSQSQMPTVALVLPRIDHQTISVGGPSHVPNTVEQSVVASSQTNILPLVSASNQTDLSANVPKRTETYYQPDNEESNLGQVSASNQRGQQQPVVASSIETAPEQSVVIASSQQLYDKTVSEPSVASSNASSSNTVTTTQAGLKRTREMEGENSKSGNSTETSLQPQVKRSRRTEQIHDDLFRSDDETSNADMLLKYRGLDVEYQVPTSSQRDQEFDNLVIDSETEDEQEEDEQAMPDDGIIDENDDGQEYVEDEEEVENEEVYEAEDYDREEQDTTMTSYNIMEGPDIDEEGDQVQDQDNEVEIIDDESNEVPNQSGRSDMSLLTQARRGLDQQSSEATSSGNNMRPQSTNITSNQPSVSLQFGRRPSTISPLNRQQNQQLLMGFEENTGDDSIVPSTPTLCIPRRTDGFGEAVSSPHVPSVARFTFSENTQAGRAGVAQMISEGIDDTRMDLSQLEENSGTGRSVPSTPMQSSPQESERIEIGQSREDRQPLREDLVINTSQQQQPPEEILIDAENFRREPDDNELEIVNESENLIHEPSEPGREETIDVTSDGNQSEPPVTGTSVAIAIDDIEEGREAEAATKPIDVRPSPQLHFTADQTARRGIGVGRLSRARGTRPSNWGGNVQRNRNINEQMGQDDSMVHRRGTFRGNRKPKQWYNYSKRY